MIDFFNVLVEIQSLVSEIIFDQCLSCAFRFFLVVTTLLSKLVLKVSHHSEGQMGFETPEMTLPPIFCLRFELTEWLLHI